MPGPSAILMGLARRGARGLLLIVPIVAFGVPPSTPAVQDTEPRVVEVLAQRFSFEPSLIEVTLDERIRLLVRSADGVHGLQIRRFNVNLTIPRGGTPVLIDFTADAAGRFPILCSEYCGAGHGDMQGVLVVHARAGAESPE